MPLLTVLLFPGPGLLLLLMSRSRTGFPRTAAPKAGPGTPGPAAYA